MKFAPYRMKSGLFFLLSVFHLLPFVVCFPEQGKWSLPANPVSMSLRNLYLNDIFSDLCDILVTSHVSLFREF